MISHPVRTASTLARVGVVRPLPPGVLAGVGRTLLAYGQGAVSAFEAAAARHPDRPAVIDDAGAVTYAALGRRTNALAAALRNRGVGEGDSVAVMCRNHRWFVELTVALGKLGADACYLNTAFSGPQLCDVVEREGCRVIVLDEEFAHLAMPLPGSIDRYLAWTDDGGWSDEYERCADLVDTGDPARLAPPQNPGRMTILTSGTTGRPQGVGRGSAGMDAGAALLSRMPLHAGGRTVVAAPLFHTWGWAHMMIGALLGSTLVLPRMFDPVETLRLVEESQAEGFVVIPVFLQRILEADLGDAGAGLRGGRGALQVVASSGSALPGDLAERWMDTFGDNLYNIYGSTEVAWCSIATPADLRTARGTAGRPPFGTTVRLYDDHDRPVADGETGRIFVGNSLTFEGYNDGGGKPVIDGLIATGDIGRFDHHGLLMVEGRDDDMIVSGGENVFPQEVEHVLAVHPDVVEVAAVGVPDDEFGQRLRAYVVLAEGVPADDERLREYVRAHLARFKVPREIVFLEQLPRNATGKVLKRELTVHD